MLSAIRRCVVPGVGRIKMSFGIHGLAAVREKEEFKALIHKSFQPPRSDGHGHGLPLPKDRILADLRYLVEAQPFSFWVDQTIKGQDNVEKVEQQVDLVTKKVAKQHWLSRAKIRGAEMIKNLESSDEELEHLIEFVRSRLPKQKSLTLGCYFGHLVEYWLTQCVIPKESGLLTGIKVINGPTTLGSLKYVWVSPEDECIMHLECSIKFFCNLGDILVGPHLSETLHTRYQFAQRKLSVAKVCEGILQRTLKTTHPLESHACIYGYVFYPYGEQDQFPCKYNVNHGRHLLPNHSRCWFSTDFKRVCSELSQQHPPEMQRWTVLPKLYWLSPVNLRESIKDLPLLETTQFLELLNQHFGSFDHEAYLKRVAGKNSGKRSRQSGLAVGPGPLMISQLVFNQETKYWEEKSRGFLLAKTWNPYHLIDAEVLGHGVPNQPVELEIDRSEKVTCLVGNETSETSRKAKKKARAKLRLTGLESDSSSQPQGSMSKLTRKERLVWDNCEHCKYDFEYLVNVQCEDQLVDAIVASMFKSCGSITPRPHMHHFTHTLTATLQQHNHWDHEDIARFALHALHELVMHEKVQALDPTNQRLLLRLVLKACEEAVSHLTNQSRHLLHGAEDETFQRLFRYCYENDDMALLHLVMNNFFSVSAKEEAAAGTTSKTIAGGAGAADDNDVLIMEGNDDDDDDDDDDDEEEEAEEEFLQEKPIITRTPEAEELALKLLGEESITERSCVIGLGLCELLGIRLEESFIEQVLGEMAKARFYQHAERLLMQYGNHDMQARYFVYLVAKVKNLKRARTAKSKFDLDERFPDVEIPERGVELPFLENQYEWAPHVHIGNSTKDWNLMVGEEKEDEEKEKENKQQQLWIHFVDGAETLKEARAVLDRLFQYGSKPIIGFDAEWGEELDLSLIQIAVSKNHVLLFDIQGLLGKAAVDENLRRDTFDLFSDIFLSERYRRIGFSVHEDVKRIRSTLGRLALDNPERFEDIAINMVDTQLVLSGHVPRDLMGVSLARWMEWVCQCQIDKSFQCSEWSARPLSPGQILYAALDSVAPLQLIERVVKETDHDWETEFGVSN